MRAASVWVRTVPVLDETPKENPRYQFVREIRERNFPPPGRREANTFILYSGQLRDGKTTMAAKTIIGCGDRTYVSSLRNHPVYTKDPSTAWRCHLSISPAPFIKAVAYELDRIEQGLPPEYLVPGSFWHFDEPSELKSVEWYTRLAKDVGDTIMENAFLRINVALCAAVHGRILGVLRDLSNLWVRVYKPGHGMVHRFENRINYKSAARPEIRRPRGICPIDDDVDPARSPQMMEWNGLYGPIKVWNAQQNAAKRLARLEKEGYIS